MEKLWYNEKTIMFHENELFGGKRSNIAKLLRRVPVVELDTITASDAVGSGSSPDGHTKKTPLHKAFFVSVMGEKPRFFLY